MTEQDAQAVATISEAVSKILPALGEDGNREGLKDTPERVARMFLEMTTGLREPAPKITTFDRGNNDQMITVLDLTYFSNCEHHLVPFFGKVHIGYIPRDRIAGLSKFGRVVDWFAKRPQIQERLTAQIADHIIDQIAPLGVIVVVEGMHMCMAMRGVKKPNHMTITSAIRGTIPKNEFFDLLKLQRG